jgi:hypothetical protein
MRCELAMSLRNRYVRSITWSIDVYFDPLLFYLLPRFSVICIGYRSPAGNLSPHGDRDGEKLLPDDLDGDGDGENSSPRGRGWGGVPRRGIPR